MIETSAAASFSLHFCEHSARRLGLARLGPATRPSLLGGAAEARAGAAAAAERAQKNPGAAKTFVWGAR